MAETERIKAKSTIVLREESDEWAILYDPDSGAMYSLNPLGVTIWKQLDGTHDFNDIIVAVRRDYKNTPDDAGTDVEMFLDNIKKLGLTDSDNNRVVH